MSWLAEGHFEFYTALIMLFDLSASMDPFFMGLSGRNTIHKRRCQLSARRDYG